MHKIGLFIESEEIIYDMSKNILEAGLQLKKIELDDDIPSVSYLNSKNETNEFFVPIEIFSSDLAPFEALVKYSKEQLKLKNIQISKFLGRSPAAVSNAYSGVKKKKQLLLPSSKKYLPLSIFDGGKLSILESVVFYLKTFSRLKNSEISSLLLKDQRTIWTVYSRVRQKLKIKNETE